MKDHELPHSSAAASQSGLRHEDRDDLSLRSALELEGKRRSLTLGTGLMCIPLAAAFAVGISAAIGLELLWLPLCALLGAAVGPALMMVYFAFSQTLLLPMTKRKHLREGLALGLTKRECREGFRKAQTMLEDRSRKRLLKGRERQNDFER